MLSIILICLIVFCAVIGGLVGALKGFIKVKSWGVEFLLTALIGVPITGLITNKTGASTVGGFVSLGIIILLIVLFMILFQIFRRLLSRRIDKYLQYNYYSHYIENEQTTAMILGAINGEDKKEYKKLVKEKNKKKRGVWGILDRVFGGVTLAVKGVAIAGILSCIILVLIDFTRLAQDGGALYGMCGKVYESGVWKFFKKSVLDFILVAILMVSIKSGYANGLSSSLWTFIVIFLVVGAAALAYYLAFKVDDFLPAAEALENSMSGTLSKVESVLEKAKLTTLNVAQGIIAVGMFVLLLVVVILIAIFVPRLIDMARESKIFLMADGILGATFMTLIILALLLVVGAVANSIHDAQFMNVFNAYFEKGKVATYIYDNNLLNSMGMLNDLPFTKWLGLE